MSEPAQVSSYLDHLIVGEPISDHDGVRCCPAINEETDEKYIVKTLSIPASATQLDALLLTGAFADESEALRYYNELSQSLEDEVTVLNRLSESNGYLPYIGFRTMPLEDRIGFEVTLLSRYRHTLSRDIERNAMTHLDAINLALDMCDALTACRDAGYLYIDLKPDNIYNCDDQKYRIGDLGFIKLDSLAYASLPDKYHSVYTAPEITDAFSSLNTTLDVFALGVILYQIYNNGQLPTADVPICAPLNADYELADIILKACAQDPIDRWVDPSQMRQELVSYMQRNGVNDILIASTAECAADSQFQEEVDFEEELTPSEDELDAFADEIPDWGEARTDDPNSFYEDDFGNLSFIEGFSPEDADIEHNYDETIEEFSEILSQADELAAHIVPNPIAAPDPSEIAIEEFFAPEEEPVGNADPEPTVQNEEPKKKRSKVWLICTIAVIVSLLIGFGGYYYYTNYYLQPVGSIALNGNESSLTITVSSAIDSSKLQVVCYDDFGNSFVAPVINQKAVFNNLQPNTTYKIRIDINGFHKLTGQTTAAYTTPKQTEVVQFNAIVGFEDGSAILGFTVNGPDSERWKVIYTAEGESPRTETFNSHRVTLTGLTIGKEYTFLLEPEDALYVTGTQQIKFTATKLIYAQNLRAVSFLDSKLAVRWSAPDGANAENWTVSCTNENGYNKTIVVSDSYAVFENLNPAEAYKIEVTAGGMHVSQVITVPANSISVTDFHAAINDQRNLALQWNTNVPVPQEGWVLQYQIQNTDVRGTLTCEDNTALIEIPVPGCTYVFTLQTSENVTLFSEVLTFTVPEATDFRGTFGGLTVTREDLQFSMCKTPSKKDWTKNDLKDSDYKTTFTSGEKASFLVMLNTSYGVENAAIEVLYIIYNTDGAPVLTGTQACNWNTMWSKKYCELDIPSLPTNAGDYTVCVYFNGDLAAEQSFTVTE